MTVSRAWLLRAYRAAGGVLRSSRPGVALVDSRLGKQIVSAVKPRLERGTVDIFGNRMYLDSRDSLYLGSHAYEPFQTSLLRRLARPGDTVLDVGAMIGYYTLLLAQAVGPAGKVFAFEPDPGNFALLLRNARINGYRNVVALRAALSDRAGTAHLYLSSENYGDHRLFDSGDGRRRVAVPTRTLDDVFGADIPPIRLVKLDVQGSEMRVLDGMARLLGSGSDLIIAVEFWPFGLTRAGTQPPTFLSRLQQLGFVLHEIDEARRRVCSVRTEVLVQRLDPDRPDQHTNLLAVRGTMPAAVTPYS